MAIISMRGGDYMAEWNDIGEGLSGDYDPNDPDDRRLLRFDVYERVAGQWWPVDGGSYCTGLPVDTPYEQLADGLTVILRECNKPGGDASLSHRLASLTNAL